MNIIPPKSEQPIPPNAQRVFQGVMFDVYQWEQDLYDGSKKIFEKLKRPDTVVVFAVLDDGQIILTQQEQPGKDPFVGAAGGRVDEGEDILSAAKRELLEETGYQAEEFIMWDAQHPTPKIDWVVYTFIAKGLKKVSGGHLDAGEKIKLLPATFDELLDIGTKAGFSEKEIVPYLYEAKLYPEKKVALQELFKPL